MRIVIDLQAAQSPGSRNRGIGRYSIALAKAMLRHRGSHEILIALNGMFAESVTPLRELFAGLLPAGDIHVWHATIPPLPVAGAVPHQRHACELVREAFLASLKPDVVHLCSMFESGIHSVSSVHAGVHALPTAVTLYDLIPHIYPQHYLVTPQARREYEEKIGHLRRADLWLAISEASRREGMERLGLPADRVVNISSAADEHFTPGTPPPEREAALRGTYGLARPFVMYTGGIDHRKNVEGLVAAWARLPAPVRESHQLAIVCAVQPRDRARLEQLVLDCGLQRQDVVLTGFVTEDDLVDLYRVCKLFVFPSLHEGFGLPALEAMRCGAPVIGSDNSSIPEVIGRADATFDASSAASISAKVLECLESEPLRRSLAAHGLQQAARFNWDSSAQVALRAMERIAGQRAAAPALRRPASRPRLALVTPMPPQRTGIADSSAELLPWLGRHYDVDLILERTDPASGIPAGAAGQRDAAWFAQHGHEYDRVLYQFGNSGFHTYMFPLLEQHPGAVVLHDFFVSGVIAQREGVEGVPHLWRALYESHGWNAVAHRRLANNPADTINAFPANFGLIRRAQGVIVHSQYALRLARRWYGADAARNWAQVPLARTPADGGQRRAARERLGLSATDFVVCSFGLLGPLKANHRLLRAWRASALSASPECQLLFVGDLPASPYGEKFRQELALHPGNARVTGWNGPQAYRDYLAAADLAVQLRFNSRGETSAAVLDCMNHGVATIANREGSMADLDSQSVLLLDRDFSDDALRSAIESLWLDAPRRSALGERGRAAVHAAHSPEACAEAYAAALEQFHASSRAGVPALLDEVAQVLPAADNEPLLTCLSRAIARNMPEPAPARVLLVDVRAWRGPGTDADARSMALLRSLIELAPAGWRVEPIRQHAADDWRYARKRMLREFNCPVDALEDEAVEMRAGDMLCVLEDAGEDTEAGLQWLGGRAAELGTQPLQLGPAGDARLFWAAATLPIQAAERRRRWWVDISELVRFDARSGIQRVVKNYLLELVLDPPPDTAVVPVYATREEAGYKVAHQYLWKLAGVREPLAQASTVVDGRAGDVFFGLDLQPHVVPAQASFLEGLSASGVALAFMVYDLLPVQLPDCFGDGAFADHSRWLATVARADMAICISQAVADELERWLMAHPETMGPRGAPRLRAVHLGADHMHALASTGIPPQARAQLEQIGARPTFLMVGTLEPRKAHAAVLAAFDRLWAQGVDVGLVISGRVGWMVEALEASLRDHFQLGDRLTWVEGVSDEYLEALYGACSCLVAASRGEGFGLPLVEAAQHGLPIIARDLPVFREVAGEHAHYFHDDSPDGLAATVLEWLALFREGRHPRSRGLPWQTWRESAQDLRRLLSELRSRSLDA